MFKIIAAHDNLYRSEYGIDFNRINLHERYRGVEKMHMKMPLVFRRTPPTAARWRDESKDAYMFHFRPSPIGGSQAWGSEGEACLACAFHNRHEGSLMKSIDEYGKLQFHPFIHQLNLNNTNSCSSSMDDIKLLKILELCSFQRVHMKMEKEASRNFFKEFTLPSTMPQFKSFSKGEREDPWDTPINITTNSIIFLKIRNVIEDGHLFRLAIDKEQILSHWVGLYHDAQVWLWYLFSPKWRAMKEPRSYEGRVTSWWVVELPFPISRVADFIVNRPLFFGGGGPYVRVLLEKIKSDINLIIISAILFSPLHL